MMAAHLFVTLVIYTVSRFFTSTCPAVRSAGPSSAAPLSSAAPKKKAFDRGGPVWLPRSNAADDRLGRGLCPPSQKSEGLGGSAPQPKLEVKLIFFEFFSIIFEKNPCHLYFWLGGAAPQTPQFLAGGAKPPAPNGRPQHLIEAAKRGRLDQMLFFRRR